MNLSRVWFDEAPVVISSVDVFATHVLVADAPGTCAMRIYDYRLSSSSD
ncbi:MAG: hypothetical protein IPO08_13965 [Xanthomonadales bacterium]|nr:hypothetical protein [Xanthomonadales bacterium]